MTRQHLPYHGILVVATFLWLPGLVGQAGAAPPSFAPDAPNELVFPAQEAKFVRLVIFASSSSAQPCIDELEVYGEDGKKNLALARNGAKATASSCLSGHALHKIEHLNDGRYGNSHSWIAAGEATEWAQIELAVPARVARVVFSRDRQGQYRDRMPLAIEVRLSGDGQEWKTVFQAKAANFAVRKAPAGYVPPVPLPEPLTWDGLLRYAFLCERETWRRLTADDHLSPLKVDRPALPGGEPYWGRIARLDHLTRTLVQFEEMIGRLAAQGLDVSKEQQQLTELRRRLSAVGSRPPAIGQQSTTDKRQPTAAEEALYLDARLAKRRLLFRDPALAPLQKILFVKRHPYLPSHNYSDILDSQFRPGGGVCVLEVPRRDGRLEPADAKLVTLFDASGGIARDAVADFEAKKIYFAYRPNGSHPALPRNDGGVVREGNGSREVYWHLMQMDADGGQVRQLTSGPFHDYYPLPLPDGGLGFITTRCKNRFLCWRPQAFTLFRLDGDEASIRPLSFANLSEWAPTLMRDGRILWTRSEYIDKGADFGHSLWAIRPDGTHPELIFGNNTPNCYVNGHEVPGTQEICCTLFSHGGDLNGPVGLIDPAKGKFDSSAVTNITPDVQPRYNMSWPRQECFRDPVPIARDYFLVSHAPADRFGLYVIDRYGNRELLYLDPEMGAMCPTPLQSRPRPPVLPPQVSPLAGEGLGQFMVADVYQGLEPLVPRGQVKYIRVCQEIGAKLEQLPTGEFRKDHGPVFQDFYATPVHKVSGPAGWPSYVAKAALGIAPVEADGSASFYAPAGKVLFFQVLDQDLNELQRMRSVIQLQPGEKRSCIGCHENRQSSPPGRLPLAAQRAPSKLEPPPWGAEPFSYEAVVQPVWNARCIRCHDAQDKRGLNLTAALDADRVPASYRTLIAGGWVHYFNYNWGLRHHKAAPLSFGTLKSRLWPVLAAGHHDVKLTREEMHRVKCWIDLNCPLWPDYLYRLDRRSTPLTRSAGN